MNLENFGPEAKAAVPALVELLHDEDERVQENAVSTLGHIGPEAILALPVLIEHLKYKKS